MRRACVRAACVRGVRAAWGTHVAVHDAVDVKVLKAKHEVSRVAPDRLLGEDGVDPLLADVLRDPSVDVLKDEKDVLNLRYGGRARVPAGWGGRQGIARADEGGEGREGGKARLGGDGESAGPRGR